MPQPGRRLVFEPPPARQILHGRGEKWAKNGDPVTHEKQSQILTVLNEEIRHGRVTRKNGKIQPFGRQV